MYCKRCGKVIDNDSMFCQHCGANQHPHFKEKRSNPDTEFEHMDMLGKKIYSGFSIINKRYIKNLISLFLISITFVLILLSYILKPARCQTRDLKEMVANKDLEKIQIVNNEVAEIFLTRVAFESGRYPKLKSFKESKPSFIYNIGDISTFKEFIIVVQKQSGYADDELIYPIFKTKH